MVSKLLEKIKESKDDFLSARTGTEFEERVQQELRNLGYSKILKIDINKERFKNIIKERVLKKESTEFLDVESGEKKSFIHQPFGSQQYPDFLIFTDKKIIPIEIKYSRNASGNPLWNSNLPKANGYYIFGSYKRRDITFFCGEDVLDMPRRKQMNKFFDDKVLLLQDAENAKLFNKEDLFNRGFVVYVRRAFDQRSRNDGNVDYFTHPQREEVENKAIKKMKEIEN